MPISNLSHYINIALNKIALRYPSQNPHSFLNLTIANFFINNPNKERIVALIKDIHPIISNYKKSNLEFNANGKKALVFLLKGHFYVHNIHNYILAHALKAIGYEVTLVTCQGDLERCGNSQQSFEFRNPPYACNVCKAIIHAFDFTDFKTISLNQFVNSNENKIADEIVNRNMQIQELNYSRNDLLALSHPYLLRFFNGDIKKINIENGETQLHLKSAVRLMLRYNKLLDQIKPDVMVFFNGTFYPEHLFIHEASKRKIPFYCTERGMKKNSLFISYNMPATNYDAGELWNKVKENIGQKEIDIASVFMKNRLGNPEDATGTKRNLSVDDIKKYEVLAKIPYVVFFAPVIHDTAAMGKNNTIGNIFDNILSLTKAAIKNKKRLVIRCHPDEKGASNPSHFTIKEFLAENNLLENEYIICLGSEEKWHPYTLAEYANTIVVYNGTLGMELSALGNCVFNLGHSHYSKKGFTIDIYEESKIDTIYNYTKQKISESIQQLALQYLYFYTHIANLSIDEIVNEESPFIFSMPKSFSLETRNKQIEAIYNRILFYQKLRIQ